MSNIIKNQHIFKGLFVGSFLILAFLLPINNTYHLDVMEVQGQQELFNNTTNQTNSTTNTSLINSSTIFRFPTLVVVTNVVNDNSTNTNASSFSQVVTNEYTTSDGFAIAYHFATGSEFGVNMNLRPGTYSVGDLGDNTTILQDQLYNTTYAGDCVGVPSINNTVIGYGLINVGDAQICSVTKTLR